MASLLLSAKLALPKAIFAHGYLTVDGAKMSKTVGNVVDPLAYIEKYGVEAVRYYLLREIPAYGDGDLSNKRFKELYNADLANGLGNLVARVAKLCERITLGTTPQPQLSTDYQQLIEQYKFNEVLELVWKQITALDQYINNQAPWKITDTAKLTEVLQKAVREIVEIVYHLQPFLPNTAEKILKQFSQEKITATSLLFPRIL